ncbi:hypothetical protein PanWU01x14_002330 [Parasponia andersonii]|uniref:Uncharacterized protein n=1 Tax=Parasponia andersonii TaxID=3476 RepID=A0A2P5E550_PARAD|nr:hypothetical protein PanWU01x14_002330 [Parasponia andersonii]
MKYCIFEGVDEKNFELKTILKDQKPILKAQNPQLPLPLSFLFPQTKNPPQHSLLLAAQNPDAGARIPRRANPRRRPHSKQISGVLPRHRSRHNDASAELLLARSIIVHHQPSPLTETCEYEDILETSQTLVSLEMVNFRKSLVSGISRPHSFSKSLCSSSSLFSYFDVRTLSPVKVFLAKNPLNTSLLLAQNPATEARTPRSSYLR